MRKVLLATTALVAMNVSAAQAADISIYGGMDWSYYSYSDGTTEYASDGNVKIKATSTDDQGYTYTVYQSVGIHTSNEEDSSITVSGDFGKVQMGGADSVIDGMDGDVSHFANDWTNLTPNHATICSNANFQCRGEAGLYGAIGGKNHTGDGGNKIGYVSPTMNNVTFAISSADTDDDRLSWALKYKNGPIAAMYGSGSEGGRDDTAYGIGVTFGETTIRYQKGESKKTGTGAFQVDRTEMGVTHSMGPIGIFAGTSKEEEKVGTADKFTANGFGATYSVAPGVTLTTEFWESENLTTSEDSSSVNLSVAF